MKSNSKILVLVEEHFDETEYNVFNEFYPANNYEVHYASYLWGNASLTFEGNDKSAKVTVEHCVSEVKLEDYKGMILIGGYAMDRLRYEPKLSTTQNQSPAVQLLRDAVSLMDAGQLCVGTICHSLWLFCADPELLRGRSVTCAHNIYCDVVNAGGIVVQENGETVEVHQDGCLITGRHPGAVDQFNQAFLSQLNKF
jgi:putative intracellular protease/amidase